MAKTQEKTQDEAATKSAEPTRLELADTAVGTYMLWSMAAGVAPIIVDTIAVSGVQLKMLHSLAKIYDIPFKANCGKSVMASLMGGIGSGSVSRGGVGTLLKMIPFIGPVVGTIAMPVLAGASTYAIGKLFIQHFESGGNFLDFDAKKMKEPFARLYDEGKNVASKVVATIKPKKKDKKDKKKEKEVAKEAAVA